jgi:hypothetical protein
LRFVEDHFSIVSAPELAHMEPSQRSELEVVGTAALESAVIASHANRILWTDDGVLALIVRGRLGVRRIWTEAGFGWLVSEGRLDREVHIRASAHLIGWGYSFTPANRFVLRAAGALAEWRRCGWPLKQSIAYLGLPQVRLTDAVPLGVFLVADAYLQAVLPEARSGVLLDVLETLGRRGDITERAFDEFGRLLPRVFGLNWLGYTDAARSLATWRNAGRYGLIRP